MITHAVRTSWCAAVLALGAGVATPVATAAPAKTQQRSAMVERVQRVLGLTADGVMGPQTRRAIKRFQRREGLRVTGRPDRATRAALGLARSTKQDTDGGAAPGTIEGSTPAPESSGDDTPIRLSRTLVKELQAALGVTADGAMGPQTRRAIRRYERRNDLRVDGKPDQVLLDALGISTEEDAASAPTSGTTGPTGPTGTAPTGGSHPEAIAAAQDQIGAPYASAGASPSGFDCSGLMVYVFKQAGVKLPRTSFDQYERGTAIEQSEIQPGDLVFFDTAGAGASHVGIATSPTTVISATSRGVKEHDIDDDYWGSHYVGARRL